MNIDDETNEIGMTYLQKPNPALMFTAGSQQDLETQHRTRVEQVLLVACF